MEKRFVACTLNPQTLTDKKKESLFTVLYIGAVFIIIALIYYINIKQTFWMV